MPTFVRAFVIPASEKLGMHRTKPLPTYMPTYDYVQTGDIEPCRLRTFLQEIYFTEEIVSCCPWRVRGTEEFSNLRSFFQERWLAVVHEETELSKKENLCFKSYMMNSSHSSQCTQLCYSNLWDQHDRKLQVTDISMITAGIIVKIIISPSYTELCISILEKDNRK